MLLIATLEQLQSLDPGLNVDFLPVRHDTGALSNFAQCMKCAAVIPVDEVKEHKCDDTSGTATPELTDTDSRDASGGGGDND